MERERQREPQGGPWEQGLGPGVTSVGEVIPEALDLGTRRKRSVEELLEDTENPQGREYRARSPTNSERMNRALAELGLAAFKIHLLLWKWRGAPAKGTLPFFTIHSLGKFCALSRPTVRGGLRELHRKGWIIRAAYNKHYKNALYRLVAIRKVPGPAISAEGKRRDITNS